VGTAIRAAILSASPSDFRTSIPRPARPLADCPPWSPPDGELLVVATHPDDEVRSAGGLIRATAARGSKVSVLSVSDGEGADSAYLALSSTRREEQNAALRKLCPTYVGVTRLGLPVGKINQHHNRLRNALLSMTSGAVTLVAPHEHNGHPDREAVGAVCLEVARSRQIPLARYVIGGGAEMSGGDAGWVKFVLSDDARRAKARAVECFKSQLEPQRRRMPPKVGCVPSDRAYEVFLL
jgi:LmbE family N-acetylglucosaminyl deacetylase